MHPTVPLSSATDRAGRYHAAWPVLEAMITGAPDLIAAMANTAAVLHEALGMHWTGFYRVQGEELLLGPFQGPPACERIAHGRGVCGTAWAQDRTVVVPDVEQFAGHIACSALSRSEVVVPVRDPQGRIIAVLDIDSTRLNDFGPVDTEHLERLCALLGTRA